MGVEMQNYISRETYAGKWWTAKMPAGQGLSGKSGISAPRLMSVCRQLYRRPMWPLACARVEVVGLPTVMRKPLECVSKGSACLPGCCKITYRWEGPDWVLLDVVGGKVMLRIVDRHSAGGAAGQGG